MDSKYKINVSSYILTNKVKSTNTAECNSIQTTVFASFLETVNNTRD